jgi:hypothetical protein
VGYVATKFLSTVMAISGIGSATLTKSISLRSVAGFLVTTGLLTVGGWLAPRSAVALTADAISPIVLIDQATNLNTNPVDPSCNVPLPRREGTPLSCPPNFGQGTVFIDTNPDPGGFTFGYTFDVFSRQVVNALGVYRPEQTFDSNNDPSPRPVYNYQSDHTVSLFQFTGTDYGAEAGDPTYWSLITSAVQNGSPAGIACSGVVKDLFCWLPVRPLPIDAGIYMVSSTGGWDDDYFADGGNVINANPDTAWIESVFSVYDPANDSPNLVATSCYTYPPSSDCFDDAFPLWAANVSIAVPTPLPVFGAAAGFAWTRRLRRRIALTQPEV